ncbi:MAG: YXWGXW repeat-containing protein [Rhodocyclaceae bacterium]|nr:YXWGXW repeat-containing protein [Rhodocyclaceae bacterium]MBX3670393.1 YXWGXW repeat-containing protein [Rhodocyclaceae bacterium]
MSPKLVALSALSALLLSACVVAPAPGPYYGQPVAVAPPAPRVEYYGAPPVVGQIWIGGNWAWVGGRYDWVPGHWERPQPGYRWVPHRWDHHGDRWRERRGYWERN